MTPFAYHRPGTLEELFALIQAQGPDARLLAGGTDLLVRLRARRDSPAAVIDLKRIGELRADITGIEGGVRIGARTVMTDVIEDTRLRAHFPALVDAARTVGSVQIRNRATLAGNLCNASPAADTAPPLLAYGAHLNLLSAGGERRMPADEFFEGPGRTALLPGELVASIDLAAAVERAGSAFERLTRRRGVDLAIASVCCVVRESGDVRFAFGAVGPRPFVVASRRDAPLDEVLQHAQPISDLRAQADYRAAMLPVLARRALRAAEERMHGALGRP